ncbi:MAG TPA: response regulator [candidate division Zixibacteria bacterium]|nr:response regulator [candidate division Zixibacteria bacterium]
MVPNHNGNQDRPILILEDDKKLSRVMVRAIENLGFPVLSTSNPAEATKLIEDEGPNLVIVGLENENAGRSIFKKIKQQDEVDLLLLRSDRLDTQTRREVQPTEVVYKPFDTRYLCRRIEDLLS